MCPRRFVGSFRCVTLAILVAATLLAVHGCGSSHSPTSSESIALQIGPFGVKDLGTSGGINLQEATATIESGGRGEVSGGGAGAENGGSGGADVGGTAALRRRDSLPRTGGFALHGDLPSS